MAAIKRQIVPAAVRNQIAALKRRVTWLEREFSRGIPERPARTELELDKDWEQDKARFAAETDYWQLKRQARLVADPKALARARKDEREFNAFLKLRGIKPLPSTLPRVVRARAPKPRKRSS